MADSTDIIDSTTTIPTQNEASSRTSNPSSGTAVIPASQVTDQSEPRHATIQYGTEQLDLKITPATEGAAGVENPNF